MNQLMHARAASGHKPVDDGAGSRLAGELATLMREIDLYLMFWEHARDGSPSESEEEQ